MWYSSISDDLEWPSRSVIYCKLFQTGFFIPLCISWQDFNWHNASPWSLCDSWASCYFRRRHTNDRSKLWHMHIFHVKSLDRDPQSIGDHDQSWDLISICQTQNMFLNILKICEHLQVVWTFFIFLYVSCIAIIVIVKHNVWCVAWFVCRLLIFVILLPKFIRIVFVLGKASNKIWNHDLESLCDFWISFQIIYKMQSETADFVPVAATWRTGRNIPVVFLYWPVMWKHDVVNKTGNTQVRGGPSHSRSHR